MTKGRQRNRGAGELAQINTSSFHVDNVTKGCKGRFGIPERRDKLKAEDRMKYLVLFSDIGYRTIRI
jgi:hypothetical protein